MAKDFEMNEVFGVLLFFQLLAVIFIFIAAFQWGIVHDYGLVSLSNFSNSSAITQETKDTIDQISNDNSLVSNLDLFFVLAFTSMIVNLFYHSYISRRLDHYTIFSYLTFGIIFFMLFSFMVHQITEWFNINFIVNFLSSMNLNLKYMNFYLDNYAIINLAIFVICILINYVDFDFSKYNNKKNKESDEI